MEKKNFAVGLWKFRDTIKPEQLVEVAEEWAAEDPHYLQLYVRKVSKDQHGIGFTYKIADSETEPKPGQHDAYFEQTSDTLKRKFGNDLVGWDIGRPVWIVK